MKGFSRRARLILPLALSAGMLGACSESALLVHGAKRIAQSGEAGDSGVYKVGKPYKVNGIWYYPKVDYNYVETGIASWYGPNFHGRRTANGELFDQNLATAAHRTLPLPSIVRVTNLENGRSIEVRVNDRGPFARGRIIDMSRRAAQLLGFYRKGTAKVRVEVMAQESRQLAALYGADGHEPQLARASLTTDGDKPPVTPAPRVAVTSESLPGAPGPKAVAKDTVVAPAAQIPPPDVQTAEANPKVKRVPVGPSNMYIQAGAFTQYDNANRLRARLSVLGPTQVSQVQVGDQTFFRVRIGPIRKLDSADKMLDRVIDAGHTEAQLVVDR